ncbi:hypothetical protein OG799_33285 [Micromonospora sp. NBC_00898]|uniref:hypothetical protein n=1 Tax=Micromonospora sp. NBC_00898 TaxID=2975981 RepID=UPI003862F5C7|nr:hypothetical protein OG799_33285 [Micromonospora sp. NBC_00898]
MNPHEGGRFAETSDLDDGYLRLAYRAVKSRVGLFTDVARPARERGHGDVLDAWGDDLALLDRAARP